jgi:transposase
VPELRRLFHVLREPAEQWAKRLWWSRFRRVHQAGAKRAHVRRRAAQLPTASPVLPPAWQVLGLASLSDEQWEGLHVLFFPPRHAPRRGEVNYRLIVEGILWVMQTGSSWRSLPARFGAWSKVLYYYRQWKGDGRWTRIQHALQIQEVPISSSA